MNVVDSSGWIEYAAFGPNASFFAPAVEKPSDLIVPTISVFEVYRHIIKNRSEEEALLVVGRMTEGALIDLNVDLALTAAELVVAHKLAMADSIILATARLHNATLWTQDVDFAGIEGVKYKAKIPA